MRSHDRRLATGGPREAYLLLRVGFTIAPILFGLDKLVGGLIDWAGYLAPWVDRIAPGSAQDMMYLVGAVEIAAGLLVAFAPWIGGYVVAGWLTGIVVNLLTHDVPDHYDVALRDVGLIIAALSLARLAAWARSPEEATSASAPARTASGPTESASGTP